MYTFYPLKRTLDIKRKQIKLQIDLMKETDISKSNDIKRGKL